MGSKPERDAERAYPIAGESVPVPARAICTVEHERAGRSEEIEFQIKWENPQ